VVAAMAAAIVANEGAQVAIMAPTSILAEQHYRTFSNLLTILVRMDSTSLSVSVLWGC
jgi:ATP-dependent DNA helicase RecG